MIGRLGLSEGGLFGSGLLLFAWRFESDRQTQFIELARHAIGYFLLFRFVAREERGNLVAVRAVDHVALRDPSEVRDAAARGDVRRQIVDERLHRGVE